MATVDVGSNSIRLLVAEVASDGTYRVIDDEKVVGRLGRGMAHSPALAPEAMEEAALAIARMKAIAEGHQVELLRAVATCAVREAENRDAFIALVKDVAGLDLEVVDGDEEARFAWLSVRSAFDIEHRDVAVVDIGGGSTEIVVSNRGMIEQVSSLSIGAIRLTEAVAEIAACEDRLKRMRKIAEREFRTTTRRPPFPPRVLYGTGGTFTTLAQIDILHGAPKGDGDAVPASVRGHEMTRTDVRRFAQLLNRMTPRERSSVPGLGADRADIIVAGLAIIDVVMKLLGVDRLVVHDRGIRDGLLIDMTRELFPHALPALPDRLRAVRRFARKCRYERAHSEHVTRLALGIFDQLVAGLPVVPPALGGPDARDLLQSAAILHDVGYVINYTCHHKHSFHLIVHSDLAGYTHRDLAVIANVARYHRCAHPKMRHAGFARLSESERDLVRHLAAILRVADGLDRAHSSNVLSVRLALEPGTVLFHIEAESEPEVDLWGAARKSRLFYKVFQLEPRFEWRSGTASPVTLGHA